MTTPLTASSFAARVSSSAVCFKSGIVHAFSLLSFAKRSVSTPPGSIAVSISGFLSVAVLASRLKSSAAPPR